MRDTIKKHNDFIIADDDLGARSVFFFVRAKRIKIPGNPRYGIIASKRTFKLAVDRNRAKRLLRDWIYFCEKKMQPNLDYIFIARHPILTATRDAGRTAMRKALHYIKKTNAQQK